MKLYVDTHRTHLFYENVTWEGNSKKKIRTIYKLLTYNAVDLKLIHNQKGSMLGRVRYIIYSTNMIRLRDVT